MTCNISFFYVTFLIIPHLILSENECSFPAKNGRIWVINGFYFLIFIFLRNCWMNKSQGQHLDQQLTQSTQPTARLVHVSLMEVVQFPPLKIFGYRANKHCEE